MPYEGYECLRVEAERGVAFVTIDHPPINLFDLALMGEIDRLGRDHKARRPAPRRTAKYVSGAERRFLVPEHASARPRYGPS